MMTGEYSFDVRFDQLPNSKQVWVGKPGSYEEGLGTRPPLKSELANESP